MSTASNKGLLAAAGPDAVVIASTESVRGAFTAADAGLNNIKPFSPQLTIPVGMRISQVAFSSDENFLVLSAENGGGLAVYDVSLIMQGSTQTAFELSTHGVALRALIPNPTPEKAELFAAVTLNGDLMMANLKTQQFLTGTNGRVMKSGVSCLSWSTRGKQLVAGLGNGTGFQMTPQGEGKAEIPRPPALDADQHGKRKTNPYMACPLIEQVSSISWLGDNVFLMVHTPSSFDSGSIPASTFHLVTRQSPSYQPPSSFMYQKLQDPCPPFGLNRSPPFHFIQRLKDFPPNIHDILVVASTASVDIGLLSRSESPLTSDLPAEKTTNVFTTTGMANDSRRAQMPMNDEMADTSPIGVALDLSSKEKVQRPLVGEELDESPTPLPALMVLNNEGILSSWWMVYSESVRQGMPYPGLAIVGSGQPQQQSQPDSPFGRTTQPQQPAVGQSPFGNTKSPTNSLGGAFGQPSTPAFGTTSAPFGVAQSQSPWGTSVSTGGGAASTGVAAFGKPAFGSATPLGGVAQGSAFGATGGLGNRQSPWGGATLSTGTTTGNTFGQPGGLGMRTGSSIGVNNVASTFSGNSVAPASTSTSGGFGSYAKTGGFASAASQGSGESVFGNANDNTSFNSGMDTDTSFGGTLGKPDQTPTLLGTGGTGGFTLGSIFKGDGTAKDDAPKPENGAGNSFFDSELGTSLEEAPKTPGAPEAGEADMEESGQNDGAASPTQPATADPQSTTPTTTPVQAKSPFPSTAPPVAGGLFGTQAQSTTTPASVQNSEPAATQTPDHKLEEHDEQSSPPNESPTSRRIKPEPEDEEWDLPSGVDKNLPEAPLPPNPTSKTSYAAGDSSASSTSASKDIHDDAPLPPDFIPPKDIPRATTEGESEQSTLSSEDDGDDEELDDEGSGEDVGQDLSPNTDTTQTFKITPESSFGGPRDRSPVGGLFSKVQRQAPQQNAKPLFGEVGGKSAPVFPAPNKVQESPRSPSPVRLSIPAEVLRPESARSVSAPGIQTKWLNHRKASTIMSTPTTAETQPELLGDGTRKASTIIFTPSTARSQPEEQGFKRQAALRARELAEEEQDLSDREDEKVREELDTEVEATTTLAPFLAHQDYVGNINKPGIPGQIERVYRDINSMVDTLGLNARSLAAFIKGHEEMYKDDGGRARSDLEEPSDWVLIEIEDVGNLEGQLHTQLAESRIHDVQSLLDGCRELQHHLVRLRHKQHDLQRSVVARTQPDAVDARRAAPLAAEQAALQHDLRRDFTHLLKRLADAEEAVSLLKAKLAASSQTRHGAQAGRQKHAVPTVEAVLKTVLTMTAMAEKKSGDVDVLETQMRRLALTSATAAPVNGVANGAGRSRDSSPFATPPPPASSCSRSRTLPTTPASGGGSSVFFTPGTGAGSFRSSSLLGSRGDGGARSTPRKKMDAVTEEDVRVYREKMTRRKEVCGRLREVLSGTRGGGGRKGRVRGVDDL